MAVSFSRSILLIFSALGSIAAVAPGGKAPSPGHVAALGGLEKGQWELRERGADAGRPSRPKRICMGDPAQLLQPRHERANCRRYIVNDDARHAVVTYECGGSGSGRTDLRVETPRLVQIDAQGVADGAPFSMSLEGRRTGDCR